MVWTLVLRLKYPLESWLIDLLRNDLPSDPTLAYTPIMGAPYANLARLVKQEGADKATSIQESGRPSVVDHAETGRWDLSTTTID